MPEIRDTKDILGDAVTARQIIDGSISGDFYDSDIPKVGQSAFRKKPNLTSVNLPNCTIVESAAFQECSKLKSLIIPKVKSLTASAVRSCTLLQEIDISSVTDIGNQVFYGCSSLPQINMPEVESIGTDTAGQTLVFSGCSALRTVYAPKVKFVGNNAFNGCGSLVVLYFPSITRLGTNAFASCNNLQVLRLGKNLTSLPDDVFINCSSLLDLVLLPNTKVTLTNHDPNNLSQSIEAIYVPGNLISQYKSDASWSSYADLFVPIEGTQYEE